MSFVPLKIVMTLGSPIYATGQPLHLDALLSYLRIRHEPGQSHGPHAAAWEPGEADEPSLPLDRIRDGSRWWWRASAVEINGAGSRQFWGKRFDREHLAEIAMGKATQVVTSLGPLKDMKVPVEAVFLPSLTWYAVGERSRVYDGLRRLRFLGKKGSQGYGEITSLSVERVEVDLADFASDWVRIDGGTSRPARNLPAEWSRRHGLQVDGEITAPLRPPYWRRSESVVCRVAR